MQAFFLPAALGERFCVFYAPAPGQPQRGSIVYIHPLAEEMNRCRRMASLQARALADAGFAVLQMDLLGCGDSSGDFANATWSAWLDDVAMARQWLASRCEGPLWLWGARAGCLLAAQSAACTPDQPLRLLLWQPVVSGRQQLQQFLRLLQISEVVRGSRSGGSTQALLQQLEQGQTVEVAGYAMGPQLAKGLSAAVLDDVGGALQVVCIEVVSPDQLLTYMPSPALAQQLQRWATLGAPAVCSGVVGEPFWQVPEAQSPMGLIQASVTALVGG
jgi:exosortase A-associated hydrolase 2